VRVTDFTRRALAWRKEQRDLSRAGWTCTSDFDWRLTRGDLQHKRIAEVQISSDGKQVWYRLEDDPRLTGHAPIR
jgi:hypothetical protein